MNCHSRPGTKIARRVRRYRCAPKILQHCPLALPAACLSDPAATFSTLAAPSRSPPRYISLLFDSGGGGCCCSPTHHRQTASQVTTPRSMHAGGGAMCVLSRTSYDGKIYSHGMEHGDQAMPCVVEASMKQCDDMQIAAGRRAS